jgi:glycosyltransferase involved in cell wall biosynthesis
MALGKPVIGTGFSGVTDFLNERNGYLVDYELTRVGADCEIYPAQGIWADPSVEHAAALMRRVYEARDEARAKGERARRDIERTFSPAATGKLARARLEHIARGRSVERQPASPSTPPPSGNGAGTVLRARKLAGRAKRAYLRRAR